MSKYCVLDETKICDDCGECNVCDLDSNKICDNCMKCIQSGADYNAVEIDEIIGDGTGIEEFGVLEGEEEVFECFQHEWPRKNPKKVDS